MMSSSYLFLIFSSILVLSLAEDPLHNETDHGKWDYNPLSGQGPKDWKKGFKLCGDGIKQSPIDIDSTSAEYDDSLTPLYLGNYKNTMKIENVSLHLENTGHSVAVEVKRYNDWSKSPVSLIYDGHVWIFSQFHFHWGSSNAQGSEHTLDGKAFPAEIHMIHYNSKYINIGEAIKQPDGLLVWGTFIEVGNKTNGNMEKMVKYFKDVNLPNAEMNIPVFNLYDLLPTNESIIDYYTYPGSLTTPGCFESVKWIVNRHYITISKSQIEEFRKLRSSTNASDPARIVNNYRPVQPLNGRFVKRSFIPNPSSGVVTVSSCSLSLVAPLVMWLANLFI